MTRTTEPTQRVHILLFKEDWEKLGLLYGDSVKRGQIVRMIVRRYVRDIAARVEQRGGRRMSAEGEE